MTTTDDHPFHVVCPDRDTVFKTREAAERHLAQLTKLGLCDYDHEIEERR